MSEIKKMFCPSCGAPVSFEVGREDTFCSHCGSQLYFKDDHLEVKLKYADKHEEREFEKEKDIREKKEDRFYMWILIGFVVFLWILLLVGLPIITTLFPPK